MHEPAATTADHQIPARPRIWPMYRAVVGTGVACALLIVMVYEITKPVIDRKTSELREQAILHVLPGSVNCSAFRWTGNGNFEKASDYHGQSTNLVAAYNANGMLVGVAIGARAMGYQDVIELIYGYSFEKQAITGIKILKSRETPGLGDRIETDPQFLRNFENLDARLNAHGDHLANSIQFVKPGKKTAGWQIDGVSGATISSRAVAQMIGESAATWIPRIASRKQDFLRVDKDADHDN